MSPIGNAALIARFEADYTRKDFVEYMVRLYDQVREAYSTGLV